MQCEKPRIFVGPLLILNRKALSTQLFMADFTGHKSSYLCFYFLYFFVVIYFFVLCNVFLYVFVHTWYNFIVHYVALAFYLLLFIRCLVTFQPLQISRVSEMYNLTTLKNHSVDCFVLWYIMLHLFDFYYYLLDVC